MTFEAWKPLFAAAALMAAAPALAQSADRVATHSDWSVFVAANPKECYIVSAPKSSAARRDGKPAEVTRGDVRLFISFATFSPGRNEMKRRTSPRVTSAGLPSRRAADDFGADTM